METEGSPQSCRSVANTAQWRLLLEAVTKLAPLSMLALGTGIPPSHTGVPDQKCRLTSKCKSVHQRAVQSVSLHPSPTWTRRIRQCLRPFSEWCFWYQGRYCLYKKHWTGPYLDTFRVRLRSKAIKLPNCLRECVVTVSVTAAEEHNHRDDFLNEMVVTRRDGLPPCDGGRNQTYPVRGDRITDSRNPVGKFYVKEEGQGNNSLESDYCSKIGATSSLLPPSCPTHTSAARMTVEEENRSSCSDDVAEEDVDGEGECPSLQGSKFMRHSHAHCSDAESSATSHIGSCESDALWLPENDAFLSNSVKDRGLHTVGRHLVVSAAEKKVTDCDDERDGCHYVDHLQGRDEDSALGFPTPASLGDADSQDIRYVNSSATSGFSEAPFPPPSHSPQYPSPSTQQPSPPHPHTHHKPTHLQHSNNTEVVQSISYTTNSFSKPTNTTKTAKEEPQHSRSTARVPPISTQGITSPKHDGALPDTLSTRHQHLPESMEVHDGVVPAVHSRVGKGDVTITTCAVPETTAGKKKDSLCLTVEAAVLPAPMKTELIVPSHTRLRSSGFVSGFVDILSSVKRFTLSTKQESRPIHQVVIPEGKKLQAGCIVFSSIAAFEEGSFLPLPSREAVERSIGKGGNGTITVVYFKGVEFAVKRTHFRQMEIEILSSLHHDNVLPLQAVMMGEEDPQRPSRFLCYHFMPRMSGDLQGYLTKVGHGALSNLLMQHKEDPTMLQLVVDNTKHILRSTLKGLTYLHSVGIVQGDVKREDTHMECMHCVGATPF